MVLFFPVVLVTLPNNPFSAPAAHCFVGKDHPGFGQQYFCIPRAQVENVFDAGCIADDPN
jgi:hypothetical protein